MKSHRGEAYDGGVICVGNGRVCNGWSLCFIASVSLSRFVLSIGWDFFRQKTFEQGLQFGKWLLLLCFTSCFTSCLGDGTRRLVLFQVDVG